MKPSREKREQRSVFDVHTSESQLAQKNFLKRVLYGEHVLNLRPNFRKRRPWAALVVVVIAAGLAFWGVRQLYTKAEITDFFPAACLGDWQNTLNAQGRPDTLNGAAGFDRTNSAFMDPTAAQSQIFCGSFVPPDYVTQGDIQNVGLTLAWQAGDSPASSSFVVQLQPDTASSSPSTSSSTTNSSTTSQNASSTTSFLRWLIAPAFAQDDTNAASVASPPADTSPPPDTSSQTAPSDTQAAPAPAAPVPAPTPDSSTIQLGPPLIAPLTPVSTTDSSTPTAPAVPAPSDTSTSASSSTASPAPAAPPITDNNFLQISYSTDGQTWIALAKINPDNWQNFTATLPVGNWNDLKNLQVKVEGIPTALQQIPKVYLDGMFVEVHYNIPPTLPILGSATSTANPIANIAGATTTPQVVVLPEGQGPVPANANGNFKANEGPTFNFDMSGLPAPAVPVSPGTASGTTTTATGVTFPPADTSTIPPIAQPPPPAPPEPATSTPPPDDSSLNPSTSASSSASSSDASPTSFLKNSGRALAGALDFFLKLFPHSASAYAQDAVPEKAVLPTQGNPVVAEIIDPLHHQTNLQPTFVTVGSNLHIILPEPGSEFRPGGYKLRLWVWQNGTIYYSENDFQWGVLVVDFNKATYTSGDTAVISFGVLTDAGHTVCDATIDADIIAPSGHTYRLSTKNGTITSNSSCGPQTVTNNPDYSATFMPKETGLYEVNVISNIGGGNREISDFFNVQDAPPFDVTRDAPTRIYPPATYQVTIHVKANQDFAGPVTETLPASFQVVPATFAEKSFINTWQSLTWNVNWKKGDTADFSYTFAAPDISPELYKLGPLTIGSWQESRQWQVAADAVGIQIRQELNLTDTVVTSTASDLALLDTTQYDGLSSSTNYFFEIVGKVTSGSATATLREFGTATDDAVITLTATAATTTRVAFTPPANASTTYFVNVSGGTSPQISAARIVVLQGGNTIVKTETQVEIGNNELGKTNTTTSTGALANAKYWFYDSTKWDGSITAAAEVSYDTGIGPAVLTSSTFTTPGANTWTNPIGNASATIELWGAGGSGGGDTVNGKNGSGGGAGGSYSKLNSTGTTSGATYSLTVAATTTATTAAGTTGASSSFNGATVVAVGGPGGAIAAGGAGGTGTATGNVGDVKNAGGNGSAGLSGTEQSGAGGGGAGSGGAGGNAATTVAGTGTANNPGGGGGAGNTTNTAGAPGKLAGGGGGGTSGGNGGNSNKGGDGAKGQVIITYRKYSTSTVTIVLQHATSSFSWADDTIIVNAGQSTLAATSTRMSFTPVNGDYYRIVAQTASSSVPYDIYGARIILDQVGAPLLTKIEPQYLLLNTGAATTTANQKAFTTFSPNEWLGVANTYVHQVDASSTPTSSVNLLNVTASTTLNTITAATTTVRSTIASMPNATSTLDISIPKGATTTFADRILVDTLVNIPSPVVSAVSINGGAPTVTLTPNATTTVNVSYTMTETGGNCANIFTSGNTTTTFYRTGVGQSCSANNLNCYITGPAQTVTDCSGGTTAHATSSVDVYYYADSTGVASSSYPSDSWLAKVQVLDGAFNTSSSATSSLANIAILTAVGVSTSTINYGTVSPGTDTSSTNQTVGLTDAGNSSTTVKVSGNALTFGANTLATSSQHYATGTFTFGGSEYILSDTATTIAGISLTPSATGPTGFGPWSTTTNLPTTLGYGAGAASNGFIYYLGGFDQVHSVSPTSSVFFAPLNSTGSVGSWLSTTPLPDVLDQEAAVLNNGYVYTIGGSGGSGITSTVFYAPLNTTGSVGSWLRATPLPSSTKYGAALVNNGYMYSVGGFDGSGNSTSSVLFALINSTGSLGSWSKTTSLPVPLGQHGAVVNNGYIYVLGGDTTGLGNFTSTVFYAPINATGSIGSWLTTTPMLGDRHLGSAAVSNGFIYMIEGDSSLSRTSSTWYAAINSDGSLGAWATSQSVPTALDEMPVVAQNGYAYILGGAISATVDISTVYVAPFLAPPKIYWGASAPAGYPSGTYTGTVTFTAVFAQ